MLGSWSVLMSELSFHGVRSRANETIVMSPRMGVKDCRCVRVEGGERRGEIRTEYLLRV